jgi:hypothetical protein
MEKFNSIIHTDYIFIISICIFVYIIEYININTFANIARTINNNIVTTNANIILMQF